MKSLLKCTMYLFFLVILFISCDENSSTDPVDEEYPAAPVITSVFPRIVIPEGYLYISGENFGQTTENLIVKFKNVATSVEISAAIESVIATKITVIVPTTLDTTGEAYSVKVTTPKGTSELLSALIYAISSSAFGDELLPGKGLVGKVYQLPTNTSSLPNFDQMNYQTLILAPKLDVPTRPFTDGFPGVPGGLIEWFGIRFEAQLEIVQAGSYNFTVGSDDGGILYINGIEIANNDGVHPYRESNGDITLTSGVHTIRVDYFQGPRTQIALRLFWTPPGGMVEIIPREVFILPESF
ncbi:MAG: PA14 domain-containing protein [Melioribacteraceae bacterium]|nr:IPT/TIG domain-containing protein [Melioribacteraceae bacterium]MDD3559841.1 PA14 domain-containing protein [Melioribacteraceae bacterium]